MTGNLLHLETSPYLLQHKDNPVHWMGWGEQAFKHARETGRPVLLSIGYAACHWCHVMAHESFEDPATADLMNANFINIKVDREERPDVDRIYMTALQAMGEQGGWPLTMFLTPEGQPFWGGTYFPPESRYGRPGFKHILKEISRLWKEEQDKIASSAKAITAAIGRETEATVPYQIGMSQVQAAASAIIRAVDPVLGGLKGAPKFPQFPIFSFLWSVHERTPSAAGLDAVVTTLKQICQGGIYDHLGGGLARYSVDARWLVPHFEKMLYDNAQFVSLLTRVWLKTRHEPFRIRIEETIDFVLREMTTTEGAFAASYDADSEGEEGKFYVWSKDEIEAVLPSGLRQPFIEFYDVSAQGNWEGKNILNRSARMDLADEDTELKLGEARRILLQVRKKRIPPSFDDKMMADWNGLMITALAEAALVFQNTTWREAAIRAMDTVLGLLWHDDRLFHTYRAGQAKHEATADGYANLITAALALHALTGERGHIALAERMAQSLIRHFWDASGGGLYFSSDRADGLLVRPRTISDDATPNANGVMLGNFTALYHLTGNADYLRRAESILLAFSGTILANPFVAPSALKSWMKHTDPVQIVATGELAMELFRQALPTLGLDLVFQYIGNTADLSPHHPAYEKSRIGGPAQLFICRGNTCAPPARTPQDLGEALKLLGLADRA